MPVNYLSVVPRPRPRPDSAVLAAAWGRPGARYALDTHNWARKQVEKIRSAWYSGTFQLPLYVDNFTEETQEIRDAYLPMLSEPMVKSAHLSKVASVQALDCTVIPVDPDDGRHRQAADAFTWVLRQIGAGNKGGRTCGPSLIADEILRPAMIAGWSLAEVVGPALCPWPGPAYGKEYWADLKSKDTRRLGLLLDEFKNVIGVRSFSPSGAIWEGRDLESFILYAHWPLYCSPSGMSDFRAVYRACWIKNVAMRLRALGLDRWTHPYLKGTASTQEQKDALRDALEDARGNGFVVLGPGDLVEAMSLAVGSDDVFHNAIQDLDREILVGVSWSHLPIQEGQTTGGRGDTSVQQGTAELGQWALAAALGGVVTGQLARPWYARNFADVEPAQVVWGAVNEQAMIQAAQLDKLLLENGMKLSRKERQNFFGRGVPADEADALTPPPKGPGPGGGGSGGAGGLAALLGGPGGNGGGGKRQGDKETRRQGDEGASFTEEFAGDAEEGPAAEADREELAGLIADMLYHFFGPKAGELLTAESLSEDFVEKFAAGWSSDDHPRDKSTGRFIKRGSPEAVKTAKDVVGTILRGDPSATPDELTRHLAILNVDQLRQLHQQAGVKRIPKEILRQHLVEAVRDRLTSSKELAGLRDEFKQLRGARPPDTMGATALRKQIELAKERPVPTTKEKPRAGAAAAASPQPPEGEGGWQAATGRTPEHDRQANEDWRKAHDDISKAKEEQKKIRIPPSGPTPAIQAQYDKHQATIVRAKQTIKDAERYRDLPKQAGPAPLTKEGAGAKGADAGQSLAAVRAVHDSPSTATDADVAAIPGHLAGLSAEEARGVGEALGMRFAGRPSAAAVARKIQERVNEMRGQAARTGLGVLPGQREARKAAKAGPVSKSASRRSLTKEGGGAPSLPKPKAAGGPKGAAPSSDAIAGALPADETTVEARDLRKQFGGDKAAFDAAIIRAAEEGKVALHRVDSPSYFTPAELETFVRDPESGQYFSGVQARPGFGGGAAKAGPVPKTREG